MPSRAVEAVVRAERDDERDDERHDEVQRSP
jgi:hypothetical protein